VISSNPFLSPFIDLSPTPPPGGRGLINLNSELSPLLSWEMGQGDEVTCVKGRRWRKG